MNASFAKPVPIVIATKTAKCLPVLFASINEYVPLDVEIIVSGSDLRLPRHKTTNLPNLGNNFGESYNYVVNYAFKEYDEIIVANDDIVLTPSSYSTLLEDALSLKNNTLGWVCSRSDYVKGDQNIRQGSTRVGIKYVDESHVQETNFCAPLFGYVNKSAWIDYKPINWYSDDIQCLEMKVNDCQHFVSRSYIHHVGSQTISMDHNKNDIEAKTWIKENMPNLYSFWFLAESENK